MRMARLAAIALVFTSVVLVLGGCSESSYRFSEIDAFVEEVDPASFGEVISDEEHGSEMQMATAPARDIEILIELQPGQGEAVWQALDDTGCHQRTSIGCYVTHDSVKFHVRPIYFAAGDSLPSGTTVPPEKVGLLLAMGLLR